MKLSLVENWRSSWRWASIRLAAIAGVLATTLISAWPAVSWAIDSYLPEGPARMAVAGVIGLVTFVIPTIARLMKR
jgi:hypothetical protein